MLTTTEWRRVLAHLAMTDKHVEPLVRWFQSDTALSTGRRKPRPSDSAVLADAEWAAALVSMVIKLKDIVGAQALERIEHDRKHRRNEALRPRRLTVRNPARYILNTYDPESKATVDFLGPHELKGGDTIVNSRGETLFLLKVGSPWIIYQNEADKRFYRQTASAVAEELRFGVFALVAEKTKYVIPMVQFVLRVASAVFPPAGYVFTASNVLHVAGNIYQHADELSMLYENICISRRNIERVAPGLLHAALVAGVGATVARLLDIRRMNVAWDEWLVAALKIVRRTVAKQAAGQFASQAAVGALRAAWAKIKAVLSRLSSVIWWTMTLARPVAVGAGGRKGGTQASSVTEVANRLAALGMNNTVAHARTLLDRSSDDLELLVDEMEELQRNKDALLALMNRITSW
jgi:hypothetical protein